MRFPAARRARKLLLFFGILACLAVTSPVSPPIMAAPGPALLVPSVSANVRPLPNDNGWNNASVVVSFECEDAPVSCSAPAPIANETTAFEVFGYGNDGVTEAQTSVFVSIDVTPPVVTSTSPSSGTTNGSDPVEWTSPEWWVRCPQCPRFAIAGFVGGSLMTSNSRRSAWSSTRARA